MLIFPILRYNIVGLFSIAPYLVIGRPTILIAIAVVLKGNSEKNKDENVHRYAVKGEKEI